MLRVRYALLAVLIVGAACSEDEPPDHQATPSTTTSTAMATTTGTTPTTTSRAQELWRETDLLLAKVEQRLDSYDYKQAKEELENLARWVIRAGRDLARALPSWEQFQQASLELAQAAVNYARELHDGTDCDRSSTCVKARAQVRYRISQLRQAWQETTAPRRYLGAVFRHTMVE